MFRYALVVLFSLALCSVQGALKTVQQIKHEIDISLQQGVDLLVVKFFDDTPDDAQEKAAVERMNKREHNALAAYTSKGKTTVSMRSYKESELPSNLKGGATTLWDAWAEEQLAGDEYPVYLFFTRKNGKVSQVKKSGVIPFYGFKEDFAERLATAVKARKA